MGLAKPYYQRVIEMTESKGGSQLTEAYKYLAYYYYVKKDRENAHRYIDKILDIDPMDQYALRLSEVI
jgi:tetratricopeptide (TPR) repeat protein